MRRFLIIIISAGLGLHGGICQPLDSVLTLSDAIGITLEKNFQIRLLKNQSEIARNNDSYGNAGFLPTVTASGTWDNSVQNTDQEFANGTTQSRNGAKRESLNAGVDLAWTLFDGTRMFVAKERLENQSLQAYFSYKVQVDQALAELLTLYYSVALEEERFALFESNLEFSEERLRIVKNKYELGKESKLALLQAQVDLNTDRSSYVQQEQLLLERKLQLLRVMGLDQSPDFTTSVSVVIDSTLVIDELLEKAGMNNPLLQAQSINQEITEQQMEELRRAQLPQLDFNLGYSYSNLESEAGFLFTNQTTGLNYGLSARMNLFDGFNRKREIQNARIQMENAEVQLNDAQSLVNSTLRITYNNFVNRFQLSKLEEENLEVARENSEIALERFRLGVSDALEIREAQTNAVNAEIRYLQSLYDAKQSEIELKRLTGEISNIIDTTE